MIQCFSYTNRACAMLDKKRRTKNMCRTLIDCIFHGPNKNMPKRNYITSWAILSTQNDCVDMINMEMIGHFHGKEMVYHSLTVRWMIRTTTTLRNSLTLWHPMVYLHMCWSRRLVVWSYCLGTLTLQTDFVMVPGLSYGGFKRMP